MWENCPLIAACRCGWVRGPRKIFSTDRPRGALIFYIVLSRPSIHRDYIDDGVSQVQPPSKYLRRFGVAAEVAEGVAEGVAEATEISAATKKGIA